jgi:hypothetical protein
VKGLIAFDTDVLTEVLLGNATYAARAAAIPLHEQAVPVIVLEEIMRGRLNIIRQAEAGRASLSLARAYELFEDTFTDLQRLHTLSYTHQAESFTKSGGSKGFALRHMICGSLLFVLCMLHLSQSLEKMAMAPVSTKSRR